MLRNLCGSVPLWQSPYAKMKSDLASKLMPFTDGSSHTRRPNMNRNTDDLVQTGR